MQFPYRRVLVIGATSGIGEALAARIVKEGSKVIVVGRREENLKAFVEEHGKDKAAAVPFDISKTDEIPSFAAKCGHPPLPGLDGGLLTACAESRRNTLTSTASS